MGAETESAEPTSAAPEKPPGEAKKSSWARNTLTRVASAFVLIPIIVWLLFWAPKVGWVIFCYVGIVVVSAELMAMTLPGRRVMQAIGVLATVSLLTVILFAPTFEALLLTLAGTVVVGQVASLMSPTPMETASHRSGWLIAGPIYLAALLSPVALLHRLPGGGAWVILTMVFAFLSDTTAYFAGSFLGRHKLYPLVSPKKTVEGGIGGLLGAVAGAVVVQMWLLPELPLLHAIGLAVVAGALGQAGDLCVSLLKRSTGVKDSGKIMPGHGGLLDRVDALAFTASTTWAYVTLFMSP